MISSILLATVLSAAALNQADAHVPRVRAVRPFSPEERSEGRRLAGIARAWAERVRQRNDLTGAGCLISSARIERTSCSFGVDGLTLFLSRAGRQAGVPQFDRLSIRTEVSWTNHQRVRTTGVWIDANDLFELAAGSQVLAYRCQALDPLEIECLPARILTETQGRLSFPRARYVLQPRYNAIVGRALLNGSAELRQNGRPIDLRRLIAAAGDFARQDFDQLVNAT